MSAWGGARVRRIRAYWQARILDAYTHGKPLQCHRCPRIGRPAHPLLPGEDFDVDHVEERSSGGALWTVTNTAPSCTVGNRAHGAHITNARRRARTDRTRPWVD